MELGKKAIFLSLSALLITSILFLSIRGTPQRSTATSTLMQAQDLVSDQQFLVENNLPLITVEMVKRTLNDIAKDTITDNNYYAIESDVIAVLQYCLEEDSHTVVTAGGPEEALKCYGTSDPTEILELEEQLGNLELEYQNLGYTVDIDLVNIAVTQVGRWDMVVQATYSVSFKDTEVDTTIEREESIVEKFSIEGLIDPMRTKMLGPGASDAIIRRHEFSETNPSWTPILVQTHANTGTYVADGDGPSYLQRFSDFNSAIPNDESLGIRSLFPDGFFGGSAKSYVDFHWNEDYTDGINDCLYRVLLTDGSDTSIHLEPFYVGNYSLFKGSLLVPMSACTP